ncbi:MAG: TonB-dependent receptor [Geminicoccaceae bacterium]
MGKGWRLLVLGGMAAPGVALAQEPSPPVLAVPDVEVVATTPLLGTGLDRFSVPSNIQVVGQDVFNRPDPPNVADGIASRLGSAAVIDSQGAPMSQTLSIRGFTVSPILGQPQGLAVYQNGVRVNDPFGDVVSWTTIPSFAINRAEVIPGSNPVFGLNALGGALSLQMKDGFNSPGGDVTLYGGPHRIGSTAEYGQQAGVFAMFGGVNLVEDNGWRDHSPANVYQTYADLAARTERFDGGISLTGTSSDVTGNGPAPKQLLQENYDAVFTVPDETDQKLFMANGRGNYTVNDRWSIQGTTYFRYNDNETHNGDTADFGACTGIGGPPTELCQNPGEDDESLLTNRSGDPISSDSGIDGILGKTLTRSTGTGASVQATNEDELLGHKNTLITGTSVDLGWVSYRTDTRTGSLNDSRKVVNIGEELGGDDFNTRLDTNNQYYGLYATDSFRATDRLTLTGAARLNVARIDLNDQQGDALSGTHDYWRINPSLGATYQLAPAVNAYASYSEANRAPTAAELACADPENTCRIPNAFTADPSLDQVVARTVEAGLRGNLIAPSVGAFQATGLKLNWSAAVYDTWSKDDIIFVASGPVVGSGYFTNAGDTNRLGAEIGLDGSWNRFSFFANYGFVRATFESNLTISSPNNPDADADGNIQVKSGDRLPNIPDQTLKAGIGYSITDAWSVSADAAFVAGAPYQGDESNQGAKTPSYSLFNVQTDYRLGPHFSAQLRIVNLFDKEYYTYGTLGDPEDVFPDFTNTQFLTPGQPRTYEVAVSWKF